MSRRSSAAVTVALLLVLSGCGSAGLGTQPSTAAPTPSPTATPERNLADVSFPEGFSESEIDTETARARSLDVLRTEPLSVVALERFRPGAYADYQYEANATRARFRFDVHNGYSDVTESDVYVASGTRHSRRLRDGRLSFETTNGSVGETRRRATVSVWSVLSRILIVGEFRAVRASGTGDERRIRYAVVGVKAQEATDVRGYLVVDGDGLIRTARLLYAQAGEPKRFEYTVRRRPDGGVAPPAWLPAAASPDTVGVGSGSRAESVGGLDPAAVRASPEDEHGDEKRRVVGPQAASTASSSSS